jgi:hypothetical protein
MIRRPHPGKLVTGRNHLVDFGGGIAVAGTAVRAEVSGHAFARG